MTRFLRWWDTTLFIELFVLLLAAPALLQPGSFPEWAPAASLGLLALTWVWRRWRLGVWWAATPIDLPLFFLFLVMLPVALWAAPPSLRLLYSIPKAYVLLWSLALFALVVAHGRRGAGYRQLFAFGFMLAGAAVAAVSALGARFPAKVPLLAQLQALLPADQLLALQGAESGINANQVAGSLLYVLPLAPALLLGLGMQRRWLQALLVLAATLFMGLVFLAAQSRFSLMGMAAALLLLFLFPSRGGRWLLLLAGVSVAAVLPYIPWAQLFDIAQETEALGSITLAGRQEIWNRALYGIQDFSFTGMGLGTFRQIVHLLYPLFTISPDYDIGHAHNFFLQTALDFGLPGLIALLAILLLAVRQALHLWRAPAPGDRFLALGALAALLGSALYGLGDAVAMGAKPHFLFWYLLALLFAAPVAGADRNEAPTP